MNSVSYTRATVLCLATILTMPIGSASEDSSLLDLRRRASGHSSSGPRNDGGGVIQVLAHVPPSASDHTAFHQFVNTTDGSLGIALDLGVRSDGRTGVPFWLTFDSSAASLDFHDSTAAGETLPWSIAYTDHLRYDRDGALLLIDALGHRQILRSTMPVDATSVEPTSSPGLKVRRVNDATFELSQSGGPTRIFRQSLVDSQDWHLNEIVLPTGRSIFVRRHGDRVERIENEVGEFIELHYEGGRLSNLTLSTGGTVDFEYAGALLNSVRKSGGTTYVFSYTHSLNHGPLLRGLNANGQPVLEYEFLDLTKGTPKVRSVETQYGVHRFYYGPLWRETIVLEPGGTFRSYRHDSEGRTTKIVSENTALAREFDKSGRIREIHNLADGRVVTYEYDRKGSLSVYNAVGDHTLLLRRHRHEIEALVPRQESRSGPASYHPAIGDHAKPQTAEEVVELLAALDGHRIERRDRIRNRSRPGLSSRAHELVLDSRLMMGRPLIVEYFKLGGGRGQGLPGKALVVQPTALASLRPTILDSQLSGDVLSTIEIGRIEDQDDRAGLLRTCTSIVDILEVGDDPDGNEAICRVPPTDPECQDVIATICSPSGGGSDGGGETDPPCSWSLSGPSGVLEGEPATYSIIGATATWCFGSATYTPSSGEPSITVEDGGPATFVFSTPGPRTITATYSGRSDSVATQVSAAPCSFDTSITPQAGNISVGKLVTATPSGNCSSYSYSTSGVSACPSSGSGSSFQTRFAAVGDAQINVSGASGGASTSQSTLTSVTCLEVAGDIAGFVDEVVCLSAQPPDPSAEVTWTAPGGDPMSGTGSQFCTTYVLPGDYEVSVSLSMDLADCGLTAACGDARAVVIDCPPDNKSDACQPQPTVQLDTAGPIVLLGSQTATISATASPPGGSYAWSATPPILDITPNNTAQIDIAATATGIATLSVVYTTATGTSASATVQVHAIDIQSVVWEGVLRNDGESNLFVNGNPTSYGGGDRIFPGQNHPTGTIGKDDKHDRVRLLVRLSSPPPAGVPVTAFFKLFDPDHYSPDTDFDPNGATDIDDNVSPQSPATSPLATAIGAVLKDEDFISPATTAVLTGDGVRDGLWLGLEVGQLQPGNNWRVAAGLNQAEVNAVVVGGDGQTLKVDSSPTAVDWPAAKQSPLLTVWRKLHAEIDRMADPVLNVGDGRSRFDIGAATASGTTVALVLPPGAAIHPSQADQFKGGRIELEDSSQLSLGLYSVTGNTAGVMPVIGTSSAPATTAWFSDLVDDDINNTSQFRVDSSDRMAVDTSWWESRFAPALVLPVFNQAEVSANNDIDAPFEVHTGSVTLASEQTAAADLVVANKQSVSEAAFWVVYQIGAFQPGFAVENDPDGAGGLATGASSWFTGATDDAHAGTLVFAEALREMAENVPINVIGVPDLQAAISVHEIAHEFRMEDTPIFGPLMVSKTVTAASTPSQLAALIWSGKGLRYIMLTNQPGHSPH